MPRFFLLATIMVFCAGCTSSLNLDAAILSYQDNPSCCVDVAEIPVSPITTPEMKFTITETDSLVTLPETGRSFARAFELPDDIQSLKLRSYLFSDSTLFGRSAIFYPVVTLLDDQRRPVLNTRLGELVFQKSSFADEPHHTHRLDLVIKIPPDIGAEYVVVHTAEQMIGKAKSFAVWVPGMVYMIGSTFVSEPGYYDRLLLHGAPVTPENYLKFQAK